MVDQPSVRKVLDFLTAHGFNRAAAALRDDLLHLNGGAVGLELVGSFLPPVRIPQQECLSGDGEPNSSSSDAFISMGSSPSELLNPYSLWSPFAAGSEDSSVRHSEFGTARAYNDANLFGGPYWFDDQGGYYYGDSCLLTSNDVICSSEDKFVMPMEDDEPLKNEKKNEFVCDKHDNVLGDGCEGCADIYACSSPLCVCCPQSTQQSGFWNSSVYASYRIMDDETERLDECLEVECELKQIDRSNRSLETQFYLKHNQEVDTKKEIAGAGGSHQFLKDSFKTNMEQVIEDSSFPEEIPRMLREFQNTGIIGESSEVQEEYSGLVDNSILMDEYEVFNLRIVHRKNRTGFEETKDLPIILKSILGGRYYVMEYLGSAAFSKVIQAHDLQTGMDVCLKIIKNDKDFFDQSLDEIKLLKYINKHDPADIHHFLRLYDYFYHQEHLFIVCELLKQNLYEFQKYNLESGGEVYFTLPRIQAIARQCLEALEYLHRLQIIHCDLKPENILIKSYSRCEIKVIDLGSSCFVTDTLGLYVQSRSYRAPEVILGLSYDPKIDIWSLGCILAELYTSEVLFPNDSVVTMLARMIGILGPIDVEMLAMGQETHKYFTDEYDLYYKNEETDQIEFLLPEKSSLAHELQASDYRFLDFLENLLQINPRKRPAAREALEHHWLSFEYQ